jgi:hypothetical protein
MTHARRDAGVGSCSRCLASARRGPLTYKDVDKVLVHDRRRKGGTSERTPKANRNGHALALPRFAWSLGTALYIPFTRPDRAAPPHSIPWCRGLLALYASANIGDFVKTMALLAIGTAEEYLPFVDDLGKLLSAALTRCLLQLD